MFRSAIASLADRATRRPTWIESNYGRQVVVHGFSPLESLVYGTLAAGLILVPIAVFLVTCP